MRGKTDEEKCSEFVVYLDVAALDFFHDTFSANGKMLSEALEFRLIKEDLIDHFGERDDVHGFIQNSMAPTLRTDDLVVWLGEMDRSLEEEKFNDESKFGLLHTSIMKIPELAHFVMFRGCADYVTEKIPS